MEALKVATFWFSTILASHFSAIFRQGWQPTVAGISVGLWPEFQEALGRDDVAVVDTGWPVGSSKNCGSLLFPCSKGVLWDGFPTRGTFSAVNLGWVCSRRCWESFGNNGVVGGNLAWLDGWEEDGGFCCKIGPASRFWTTLWVQLALLVAAIGQVVMRHSNLSTGGLGSSESCLPRGAPPCLPSSLLVGCSFSSLHVLLFYSRCSSKDPPSSFL